MKTYYQYFLASNKYIVLSFLLFIFCCQSPVRNEMNTETRNELVKEITNLMNNYGKAVMLWDEEAIDSFWGEFDGFVFAGDGVILGGHDEWSSTIRKYKEQVDRWFKFEYHNMHIEVLSVDVATVTTEFEHSRITVEGDTINVKGAWTYVFKKSNDEWDVVQTNGTHIEF